MARPTMLSRAFKNVYEKPTTFTTTQRSTERYCRKLNTIVMQNSLRLVAWTISGGTYLHKEYQKGLPTLSQTIGEHLQSNITSHLGRSSVVGVLSRKYLPLDQYKLRTRFFGRIIWKGVGIQKHWYSQVCNICVSLPNWEHSSRQSPKVFYPHVRYIQ